MSNTKNCRNISGILQVLIKFKPSNGALSEIYTEAQNQISVSYVQLRRNFILINLGDNNLLNKKSEFVNKCRYPKKTVIK